MKKEVWIIEDDEVMLECEARAVERLTGVMARRFKNVVEFLEGLREGLPDMVMLDILLDGYDGFSLINELATYTDTAQIPLVIVSGLKIKLEDLDGYGVVAVLDKETMTPEMIRGAVREWV